MFFQFFGFDSFLNGFPNPFIVRSRSSFLFDHCKCFELCVGSFFVVKTAMFLQFKEFELYWGAVFFLRSVQTFS